MSIFYVFGFFFPLVIGVALYLSIRTRRKGRRRRV